MTCPDCNSAVAGDNSQPPNAENNPSVTYNNGEGIKTTIVTTGPLAETLAAQLNTVFKKVPLDLGQTPDNGLDLTKALETIVQDEALRAAYSAAAAHPENQVVLHGFDVKTIKEHVARMHEGDPKNEDLTGVKEINVVAGDIDQLLDGPGMSPYDLKDDDEIVLFEKPVAGDATDHGASMVLRGSESRIIRALNYAPIRTVVPSGDYPTVTDKVQALERVYPGMRVHVGAEGLFNSLIQRAKRP